MFCSHSNHRPVLSLPETTHFSTTLMPDLESFLPTLVLAVVETNRICQHIINLIFEPHFPGKSFDAYAEILKLFSLCIYTPDNGSVLFMWWVILK